MKTVDYWNGYIIPYTQIGGFRMSKNAKITVHPSFEIGDISNRLFSAFLEPIGTIVNGTMFNPKHPTADDKGFRTDFIDALKATGLPADHRLLSWRASPRGIRRSLINAMMS